MIVSVVVAEDVEVLAEHLNAGALNTQGVLKVADHALGREQRVTQELDAIEIFWAYAEERDTNRNVARNQVVGNATELRSRERGMLHDPAGSAY